MVISKADLDAYRAALRAIAQNAVERVSEALSEPRESRNAARQAAIDAINESIGVEGDMAQSLAGQLFDEVCDMEDIDATFEIYDDLIDPVIMARKVYYYSRTLVESDTKGFAANCAGLADYYAMRCANDSMMRNVAAHDLRYARVPTGVDTCDFCLMLASRGFVYHSAASAEAGMHLSCDCIVCPGIGGDGARSSTQIEGYDPDELYDLWQGRISHTANERAKRNGTSASAERIKMIDTLEAAARESHLRNKWRWRV